VPKHGDAEFRIQVFPVRAVHHARRIMDNREMDKRDFAQPCALLPAIVSVFGRRCSTARSLHSTAMARPNSKTGCSYFHGWDSCERAYPASLSRT
jgi:hypothetical protein